jgi:hypothetical protein
VRISVPLFACIVTFTANVRATDAAEYDPPRLGSRADLAPRLPAPFVLPDLSHPFFDVRVDGIVGSVAPSLGNSVPVAAARAEIEGSVFLRRQLYLGLAVPYGAAPAIDREASGGRRDFLGNAEAHVRVVFPMPTSLDFGFLLGLMLPTAAFDRGSRDNQSASAVAASVTPSDVIHFLPGRFAFRPAADARVLRGPLVVQARQGIDIVIDEAGVDRVRTVGRLLAHVGVLVRRDVEVSMEASQVYFFASDDSPEIADPFAERYRISDDRRSAFTVGPGLRFSFPDLDVGVAASTNVGRAFSPAADGLVAARLSLVAHLQ